MNIRQFQKQYSLSNKDMAQVCRCSLPTIQKWRSGEVSPSGSTQQLINLLHSSCEGSPTRLREVLSRMNQSIGSTPQEPDGELKQLESSMTKVMNRLELMLEARRKERELLESEARYRSMVESQDDPVCRWKPDTTLTFVNEAYARLYSTFGTDLIGKKWLDFIPPARRNYVETLVSDIVRRGEPEVMNHESVDKDGVVHYQEWRDIPIKNERGDVVEFHSVAHDRTDLVNALKEKDELGSMLEGLMTLSPHPVVVFDAQGRLLRMNDLFRDKLCANRNPTLLGKVFPELQQKRFARLLLRLSDSDHILYRVRQETTQKIFRAKAISLEAGREKFIGIVEELQSADPGELTRVRLASEGVIGGGRAPASFLQGAVQSAVIAGMESLAEATRADRVYVFSLDDKTQVFDNVLEWCRKGVAAHIDELQRIPYEDYNWWIKRIKGNKWINIEDTLKMPRTALNEQQVLRAQGICSVLVAPLEAEGKIVGFAGLDHNDTPRLWHNQEIDALKKFKRLAEQQIGKQLASSD
jgi:PAS domain S-box-containing protein